MTTTKDVTVIQADEDAALAMLNHAFRNVDQDALSDVAFTDIAEHFRDYRLSHTEPRPASDGECAASPDHADILETIENAAADWQKQGYTSALAEVRDMANVGRALMEALPDGYSYMNCPSEIVSDLQNERDEALAVRPASDALRERVAEVIEEDGGCWTACSGCQESNEGYVSERDYPYSPIFKCQPGGGCRECGGIGVIWQDGAFLASYGDALATHSPAPMAGEVERLRELVDNLRDLADRDQSVGDRRRNTLRKAASEIERLATTPPTQEGGNND